MKTRDSRKGWYLGLSKAAEGIHRGQMTTRWLQVDSLVDFYTFYDCRSTAGSELRKRNSRQQLTHAVQQPNSPTDQMKTYQINPTIERQTLKRWCQSCVVGSSSTIGLIMNKFKDAWLHPPVALTTLPPRCPLISSLSRISQATRDELRTRELCI